MISCFILALLLIALHKWCKKYYSRIIYHRNNVRVKFDPVTKEYPQAYLQYKTRFRWVTVNESYYHDCHNNELSPSEIFNELIKEGQRFKRIKIKQRNFKRELLELQKSVR